MSELEQRRAEMAGNTTGFGDHLAGRLQEALLTDPAVGDCAVLPRRSAAGQELVSYVAPAGPLNRERLEAIVRANVPELQAPLALVPVSAIPLRADGEVDADALAGLAVGDAALEAQCRELLGGVPGVRVELRENRLPTGVLHVADLLPGQVLAGLDEGSGAGRAVRKDEPGAHAGATPSIARGLPLPENPGGPVTLQAALRRAAGEAAGRGVIFVRSDGPDEFETYAGLLESAERVLHGLRRLGLRSGDPVLFQLEDARDFLAAFWGCVLGGMVPAPVSIAPAYDQASAAVSRLHNAWSVLGRPMVLASDALAAAVQGISRILPAEGLQVQPIGQLLSGPRDSDWHASAPDDLALLLLTSGSTGAPKAVMQSHRALLSRSTATALMNGFSGRDVSVNWLPLDHVGGIVMFHLHDLVVTCTQVHARTQDVLAEPLLWLDWLDRYRATHTWAPNFAFALVNERAEEIARRRWDLSRLRFILNGGEAIIARTARRFLALLAPHGLPQSAMHPAWGMSETCSGVTFSRDFSPARTSDEDPFVEVGEPVPGFAVRIADAGDLLVPEGSEGRLQVQGPSVLSGYFRNPEATRDAFTADGWFNTGDRGILRNGRLTITGRDKEVIIIHGANYAAHEIERIVEELPGVAVSFTAAFAVRARGADTDQLAICFSPAAGRPDDDEMRELLRRVRSQVAASIGTNPRYLIPVDRETVPKTSIGKIQRSALALRLRAGEFDDILRRVDLLLETGRTIPDWFYRKVWRRRRATGSEAPAGGCCLIFADAAGVGERLAGILAECGGRHALVRPGSGLSAEGGEYRIDPREPSQYVELLRAVLADRGRIDAVVHLWACDTAAEPESIPELDLALDTGVMSVLHLVQALHKVLSGTVTTRLLAVTRGAQGVTGPASSSGHSALSGLLATVRQEFPWIVCRCVDLESGTAPADARLLHAELRALPVDVDAAWRGGDRWVSRLANAELAARPKLPLPFVPGGVYALTGGLGGIAMEVARHLAKEYGAKLLLIGRTPLDVLQPEERRNALDELRSLGAEARYTAADVCDAAALERAVEEAEAEWRAPLAGLLHLAGTHRECLLAEEEASSFRLAMAAKVHGAWAVRRLLARRPDAFLAGFSSVNGFFGGFGAGAYAAANAYLDGSIEQERARGRRAVSLAWSLWDEVGMSLGYDKKEVARIQGFLPISRAQGMRSLLAALQSAEPVVFTGLDAGGRTVRRRLEAPVSPLQKLVVTVTGEARAEVAAKADCIRQDRFGGRAALEIVVGCGGAAERAADVDARPASELERSIARIWGEVLGTSVDLDANFFDLGGSSLLAAQVYRRIRESVSGALEMTDLFRFPTVRSLCERLSGREGEQSARLKADGERGRSSRQRLGLRRAAQSGPAGHSG